MLAFVDVVAEAGGAPVALARHPVLEAAPVAPREQRREPEVGRLAEEAEAEGAGQRGVEVGRGPAVGDGEGDRRHEHDPGDRQGEREQRVAARRPAHEPGRGADDEREGARAAAQERSPVRDAGRVGVGGDAQAENETSGSARAAGSISKYARGRKLPKPVTSRVGKVSRAVS